MSRALEYCGRPMHKRCRCVRPPGHDGLCNCTYRYPAVASVPPPPPLRDNRSLGEFFEPDAERPGREVLIAVVVLFATLIAAAVMVLVAQELDAPHIVRRAPLEAPLT